ncbi:MAG: hypothetical protein LLF94_06950 [Chlamydiales bacterium]|nr:hypothetical protein [Chlamydiales bacterium]
MKKETKTFPRFVHILWMLLLIIALRAGYYWTSDGFSVSKIKNTFPVTSEWQLSPPSTKEQKQIHAICAQEFRYLGKGSQVYAFISEDRQYVLKLFKCYHLKPVDWIARLPLPEAIAKMRDTALDKRYKKIDTSLKSYKIASQSLKDECGLISLEIVPTPVLDQEVVLFDKLGRKHTINLGDYGYILQKRADLVYPRLSYWIANNDLESAKKAIHSMIALIVQRSRKGIQDSDPDLHKNAGLIGTTAIFIDLGSFHANKEAKNEEVYMQDINKITNRLREWLEKQSPELHQYLLQEIKSASSSHWQKPV